MFGQHLIPDIQVRDIRWCEHEVEDHASQGDRKV